MWEPSEKESEEDDDQDWAAMKPRMKVNRRYTSKPDHKSFEKKRCTKLHVTNKHVSIAPGQIVVSTPLLVRTVPQPVPNTSHHNPQRHTQSARDISDGFVEEVSRFSKRDNSHNDSLTDGLCVAVDVLLRSTCDEKRGIAEGFASARTGSRSLFSMCLRAVPNYIVFGDGSGERDSDRDEEDATAETYTWLEENECMPGRGWPHMRQVVRAHAMHLLKEAIQDGTLSARATNAVLRRVFLSGSLEQVWMLREVLLDIQGVDHTKSSSAGPHLLNTNDDGMRALVSTISTVFNSFHLRCMFRLLNSRKLDILRLANRDFEEFWVRIINSLSQRDSESHAALQLVEIFLSIACEPRTSYENDRDTHALGRSRCHETVLQNRVTSLCVILVTIGLTDKVNSMGTNEVPLPDIIRPIRSAVVTSSQKDQSPRRPILACIIATADLVFELSTLPDDAGPAQTRQARQTIRHINRVRTYDSNLGPRDLSTREPLSCFVSALALCYDRTGQCGAGFTMLKHVARRLMDPRLESVAQDYPFAWTLALRSAAAFAQQSNKAQHVIFAQQLERVASDPGGRHTARTCSAVERSTQSARYRWEEGICEWVVATPARVDFCKVEGTAKSLKAAGNKWATRTRKRKTAGGFVGGQVLEDEEDLSGDAAWWTLAACVVPGEDFMTTSVSTAKVAAPEHKRRKSGPLVPRSGNDAGPTRRSRSGTCPVASENNDDNNEKNDDDVDELSACLDTVSTTRVMHKRRKTIRRANQPFIM